MYNVFYGYKPSWTEWLNTALQLKLKWKSPTLNNAAGLNAIKAVRKCSNSLKYDMLYSEEFVKIKVVPSRI